MHGVRNFHTSGDYLLRDNSFVMVALMNSKSSEVGPITLPRMTVECPNHKGGHYIDATKLRSELEEARQRGGDRGSDIARVVVPLDDGTPYDKG